MSILVQHSRKNASILWKYFKKFRGVKKCRCRLCGEMYSFATTTGNLKCHLLKKHKDAYIEVAEYQKQQSLNKSSREEVIYEYLDSTSDEEAISENGNNSTVTNTTHSKNFSTISSEERVHYSLETDKIKERKLAELSEEKLSLTKLQKELIEKELVEINLKASLLAEVLKHRREVSEFKKQEIKLRTEEIMQMKEINELTKTETLLKLELLNKT